MNSKVVYGWFADGSPFYIGIGTIKRSQTKRSRNSHCLNKRNKAEKENSFEIRILHCNLSWEEACEIEISLISLYGRRDLGTGILTNMTSGGDYSDYWKGRHRSKDTKDKLREINSGSKHPQYGKQKSDKTKIKIRKSMLSSKHIVTPLGTFTSQNQAAKAHKCSPSSISRRCNSSNFPDYMVR